MGKYASIQSDIYSIFAQPAWLAENIKTIPSNYSAASMGAEFLRVSVLPVGGAITYDTAPIGSGQLIIDIFVPAGNGQSRLAAIADKLDSYLVKKTVSTTNSGTTQFGGSSLNPIGLDSANPSLYRASYSINFNYFGK